MRIRWTRQAVAIAGTAVFLALGVGVASAATIIGDDTDNVLTGTDQADLIKAMGGNDTVTALEGTDRVHGGTGNDSIDGGPGDDQLSGGEGDDTVVGGDGSDYVRGRIGNDALTGDEGRDLLRGGRGDDREDGGDRRRRDLRRARGRLVEGGIRRRHDLRPRQGRRRHSRSRHGVRRPRQRHVFVRDGEPDVVACGSGFDLVFADSTDLTRPSCERVRVGAPKPHEDVAEEVGDETAP